MRVKAGNAPDIAFLPQPGLLQTIVRDTGTIVPAPESVAKNVDEFFEPTWKDYGTVDGVFYAAPMDANVKSYVWYSPAAFADGGYEIPETWDDLIALSEQYSEDNDGALPWCAGVESGDATGWPGTDWVEDMMLRTAGPDVYDQWYTHEIPFNDPQVVTAFDTAGEVLKDPAMVNAGLGGVDSIATTPWTEAGIGLLDGTCFLHRAANFYQTQFPEGTDVSEDGEVYAFYLPTNQTDIKPVEVGGTFAAAFNDRPEVQAFQTYISSADWANAKAKATPNGGWVNANLQARPGEPRDRVRPALGVDPHRRELHRALRRVRPDARGRRRRDVLDRHRQLAHRPEHAGGRRPDRGVLADVLTDVAPSTTG